MSQAPRIETARITGQFQIEIHWSTGEVFTTDLKDLKDPAASPRDEDPFRPLHDPAFFAQVRADDWGNGLSWPGELDPGADRLYALGRKQAGLPRARISSSGWSGTTSVRAIRRKPSV